MTHTTSLTEKIGKLLAQAEGAGTEAEAAVFTAKAQQLATHFSIDLAKARHATESKHRTVPVTRQVRLGEKGTRGLNTLVELITRIGSAQGVHSTIAHNNTFVNFYGFDEDIDITEALYASLATQMVKACEEFKASGEWKKDTYWRDGRYTYRFVETGKKASERDHYCYGGPETETVYTPGGEVPIPWLTARLNFQEAFAYKVGSRLSHARHEAERAERQAEEDAATHQVSAPHLDADGELTSEFVAWFDDEYGLDLHDDDATASELRDALRESLDTLAGLDPWYVELVGPFVLQAQETPVSTGTELVLADKSREVQDYYKTKTGHIRGTWKGSYSGSIALASRDAGRAAGSSARLSNSTALGGSKRAIS